MSILKHKFKESVTSILPIALIVLFLSLTIVPMDAGDFLVFLFGVVFLIVGLSTFNIGAEMSMYPLGSKIGSTVASTGKVWLIAFVSFIIGIIITVSEPDLQILAGQVAEVENIVLIMTVSIGVGIFLVFALLRIVCGIPLAPVLMVFYAITFALCFFVSPDLLCVAFDSGGVTTGPMTVPFLMALGTGVSSMLNKEGDDSFSIVSMCSVGPIISVLVLGIFMKVEGGSYTPTQPPTIENTRDGLLGFVEGFADYGPEVAYALLPIVVFTVLFQLLTRAFGRAQLFRIAIGVLYTFLGLTVFLTGANIGFVPIGMAIGENLASVGSGWILLPVSLVLGYFIVQAEPAVYVLNRQVEQLTAGAVSSRTTGLGLSFGVAAALFLSMLRILTGLSIMWILVPGYIIAFVLSFFVPRIFVGIAFDSGGVASGTMMSAFVLPLAIGACGVIAPDAIMTQAFGCVSFVALTPIISVQICGLIYRIKQEKRIRRFVTEQETFLDYSADFILKAKEVQPNG